MRLRLAAYLAEAYDAQAYDAQASEDWRKKYDYVRDFHEGFARVELNDKWGFVNQKGEEVVELKYVKVYNFHEGLAQVMLNRKWGYVDTKGEEVVPPGKYNDEDLKSIKTYLKLGGNPDVILPNFKPIA